MGREMGRRLGRHWEVIEVPRGLVGASKAWLMGKRDGEEIGERLEGQTSGRILTL